MVTLTEHRTVVVEVWGREEKRSIELTARGVEVVDVDVQHLDNTVADRDGWRTSIRQTGLRSDKGRVLWPGRLKDKWLPVGADSLRYWCGGGGTGRAGGRTRCGR